MPDENEVVADTNPNPIVGVQGPSTPPAVTGRSDADERRKRRFGPSGATSNPPADQGGPSSQDRRNRFSRPSPQESSGKPAAAALDQAVSEQAVQTEAPKQEAGHPNEGHVRQPPGRRFWAANQADTTITSQNQARSFAESMDNLSSSNVFTSMPHLCKSAVLAVRRWQHVPEDQPDDQVLATINPNLVALIMQIVQQVIACIPNNKDMAWGRVVNYSNAKPFERLGDNVRLNAMINRWMDMLAVPREVGDVVVVRNAITDSATSLNPDEFAQLQQEVNFLTI